MKPFFSIIVPCCEVEQYVRECFDSVLNQSFADWELIAGVETSKDKTEDIVREYVRKDPRIKMTTGPRSGSPSTPRNKALEIATGEYVIFLDGDDTIAEESLKRLHDKIAAHPGADLYPCAMTIRKEVETSHNPICDNYAEDFSGELAGPEATIMVYTRNRRPCPMLQLTICRREYLNEKNLRCVPGLRREDQEFSPRALYLAKRVVPLHEKFYIYRIRAGSVITAGKNPKSLLGDLARCFASLSAFHAEVSRQAGFDTRISALWGRHWLNWLSYHWFSPGAMAKLSRRDRLETLKGAFPDGFANFDLLAASARKPRKAACMAVKLFAKHPAAAWLADAFFRFLYNPLCSVS